VSASVTGPLASGAGDVPAGAFADVLTEALRTGSGGVLTWLNHYSALQALQAGVPLDQFDYLGLDGIFLARIVRAEVTRTSADLLLPVVLERTDGLRVALIGSTTETLAVVARKIEAEYGHQVVLMCDGYSGLPEAASVRRQLQEARVDLAVVALGAPRQDFYALELRSPGTLVTTCGGWLDQFAGGDYYPRWAYPLRLNWLVRLCREPARLWRRYSVDALRAVRATQELTDYVTGLGGRALQAAESGRSSASDDLAA
jgi:exopolysaccharide biosynthesis WecB/TagA/CpsF family protein